MGFSLETGVPALTVFLQGLLSFFSPCILPLVPLYVSYLAGGARKTDENGVVHYPRGKVMLNTLFFVLGISFTFVLLGFGFTALGQFFNSNRAWLARISGIVMIVFGLYQFGALGRNDTMQREHRLSFRLDRWAMNPLVALLLGFTFSFAWTPCVGPTLGSVLLMASSASTANAGLLLIGVYTLGFILPFLTVGMFTGTVLEFFKKHRSVVRYTVKVGAGLLILMGVMTLTGFMNSLTGYLSSATGITAAPPQTDSTAPRVESSPDSEPQTPAETPAPNDAAAAQPETEDAPTDTDVIPAPDFTLTDQNGNTHKLSDYRGKTVFLNFWATWCPPCRGEMPDIQAMYKKYGNNEGDLIVLGVASPRTEQNVNTREQDQAGVEKFLSDSGYTFPVIMDVTGELSATYGITALPTTFMIDKDGNVFGYVASALTPDMMESIVQQTMTGKRTR